MQLGTVTLIPPGSCRDPPEIQVLDAARRASLASRPEAGSEAPCELLAVSGLLPQSGLSFSEQLSPQQLRASCSPSPGSRRLWAHCRTVCVVSTLPHGQASPIWSLRPPAGWTLLSGEPCRRVQRGWGSGQRRGSRAPAVSRCVCLVQTRRRLPGRVSRARPEADPPAGECAVLSPVHPPRPREQDGPDAQEASCRGSALRLHPPGALPAHPPCHPRASEGQEGRAPLTWPECPQGPVVGLACLLHAAARAALLGCLTPLRDAACSQGDRGWLGSGPGTSLEAFDSRWAAHGNHESEMTP